MRASCRERKRRLRGTVPSQPSPLLYAKRPEGAGIKLFRTVCDQEGIVAKIIPTVVRLSLLKKVR